MSNCKYVESSFPYSGCIDLELYPDYGIVRDNCRNRDSYAREVMLRFGVQNGSVVGVSMIVLFKSRVEGRKVEPILLNDLSPYGVKLPNSFWCLPNFEDIIRQVIPDDAVCFFGRDGKWRDCKLTIWKPDQSKIIGEKSGRYNFVRLRGTTELGDINYQCRTNLEKDCYGITTIMFAFSRHLKRFSAYRLVD